MIVAAGCRVTVKTRLSLLRYTACMFWRRKQKTALKYLVFGLGNPGPGYVTTRHNTGWWVLDALARELGVKKTSAKSRGQVDYVTLAGLDAALIKPTTFMNRSGQCVLPWVREHSDARFTVVYDDIAIPAGTLRLREKGSAGGHKGMKSIIEMLGTDEFDRLRVGVGPKPDGLDSADYVLEPPTPREEDQIMQSVQVAVEALKLLAGGDFNAAQRLAATAGQTPQEGSPPHQE